MMCSSVQTSSLSISSAENLVTQFIDTGRNFLSQWKVIDAVTFQCCMCPIAYKAICKKNILGSYYKSGLCSDSGILLGLTCFKSSFLLICVVELTASKTVQPKENSKVTAHSGFVLSLKLFLWWKFWVLCIRTSFEDMFHNLAPRFDLLSYFICSDPIIFSLNGLGKGLL